MILITTLTAFVLGLLLHDVSSSSPWVNPNIVRCRPNEGVYSNPCLDLRLSLTWRRIETELFTNQDLRFVVEVNSTTITTKVNLELHICRSGAIDCNPVRTIKNDFRSQIIPLASVPANGSVVDFTFQTTLAERQTFVFIAKTDEVRYYIGVTRDVMSGKALQEARVDVLRCPFILPDATLIDLRIQKVESQPGLAFSLVDPTHVPSDMSYQMHVHDTGDTRSFANALGHFIGTSLDPARLFEAGMIINSAFRVVKGLQPFVDPVVEYTGINGILGRSLIMHDAKDGSRVAQCLPEVHATFSTGPMLAPVPDYDSTICVFPNGDVVQMEVQDPTAETTDIVIRYSFEDVKPVGDAVFSSLKLVQMNEQTGTTVLANLFAGSQTNKVAVKGLKWYDFRLGAKLVLDSKDSCTIGRQDRSGMFFPRELRPHYDKLLPVTNAITTASCVFTGENIDAAADVVGQVVFSRAGLECDGPVLKYDNCVRMDYFISDMRQASSVITLRQFGAMTETDEDENVPLFAPLKIAASTDCSNDPLCALGVQPPPVVYQLKARTNTKTASGVLFSPIITMNGINSIIGRSMYLHESDSLESAVVGKCVVGIDSISLNASSPRSPLPVDNTDRAYCTFLGSEQIDGSITFTNNLGSNNIGETSVRADIIMYLSGEDFYRDNLVIDFDPLVPTALGAPIKMALRTSVLVDDEDTLNTTISAIGTVDIVSSLFGYPIGVFSDIDGRRVASCVVGMAPPTTKATGMPTLSPTKTMTMAPTVAGETRRPSLRPPPSAPAGGDGMPLGSVLVLSILLIVIFGSCCVLCIEARRRFKRAAGDQYGAGAGVGDGWNFHVEMSEQGGDQQPLKPLKPSAAKFSSTLPDDDDFDEEVDEQEMKAAAAKSAKRKQEQAAMAGDRESALMTQNEQGRQQKKRPERFDDDDDE